MTSQRRYDAVVVGAGPNGLAAAIEIARAARSVLVVEGADTVGGGTRSEELTRPGFTHDVCSAIHPLVAASPFFQSLPLAEHGLELVQPDVPLAHPFDDGSVAVLERSVDATAQWLEQDGDAYRRLVGPHVRASDALVRQFLGPFGIPRHPIAMARLGLRAIWPLTRLATRTFETPRARGLLAGLAAHSMLPLSRLPTGAFGVFFSVLAHAYGWPLTRGGSGAIAAALEAHLRALGGEIETGRWVSSIRDLPPRRAALFDVTPRQLAAIAGDRLPRRYLRALDRYRYGPGIFKVDWALDGPIPWKAEQCSRAATVHIGSTLEEIAESERDAYRGRVADTPFVLLAQQSLFDPSRAPAGKHTGWAYCHVPAGADVDMTDAIEAQVERFAPGFRDLILERSVRGPADWERYNPNYVGGDINGGVQDIFQLFTRPAVRLNPYTTPNRAIYICSSSTPPGGGVHGMCGYFAARAALRRALK